MKKLAIALCLLLVFGVTLTGCSKSTTDSSSNTASTSDTPPEPPTSDIPSDTAQ